MKYFVTIPYQVSKNPNKKYTITYNIEAQNKLEAKRIAINKFNEFMQFTYASWVRTIFDTEIRIRKKIGGKEIDAEMVESRLKELESPDLEVKLKALTDLKELEDDRAVKPLLERFSKSEARVKVAMLDTIRKCGDVYNVPALMELYDREEDPFVRATLVKVVGYLGDASHIPFLKKALEDPNSRVIANTIEALEQIGGDTSFRLIMEHVDSDSPRIKANAIAAIYRMRGLILKETIEEMFTAGDESMRASAIYIVGELKLLDSFELLDRAFNDPSSKVRINCVKSLGKLGTRESIQLLIRSLGEITDPDMLEEIKRALIHCENYLLVGKLLLEALKKDTGTPTELLDEVIQTWQQKNRDRRNIFSRLNLQVKKFFSHVIRQFNT